jgi:hypothetical protein
VGSLNTSSGLTLFGHLPLKGKAMLIYKYIILLMGKTMLIYKYIIPLKGKVIKWVILNIFKENHNGFTRIQMSVLRRFDRV